MRILLILRASSVLIGAALGGVLGHAVLHHRLTEADRSKSTDIPHFSVENVNSPRLTRLLRCLHDTAGPVLQRNLATLSELDSWMSADPVGCVNAFSKTAEGSFLKADLVRLAIERAAGGDPQVEIQLAKRLESGAWQDIIIKDAFPKLIKSNLDAAVAEYSTLMPQLQQEFAEPLGIALGKKATPDRLTQLFSDPSTSSQVLQTALMEWARQDSTSALNFIGTAPETLLANKGLSRTSLQANAWEASDPAAVLADVETQEPGTARDLALARAIGKLIAKDAGQADQLASQYAGQVGQVGASLVYATAAYDVAGTQPERALQYLENIQGERDRSEATKRATMAMLMASHGSVVAAQQWLGLMTDPVLRAAAMDEFKFQNMKVNAPAPAP